MTAQGTTGERQARDKNRRVKVARSLKTVMAVGVASALAGCALVGGGGNNEEPIAGDRVSVLAFDSNLVVDRQLAQQQPQLPPPFLNDAWPQPGGFPHHAMQHLEVRGDMKQLWRDSIGAGSTNKRQISATPIVAGGLIFTLDAAANVSAHDANTGNRLWRKDLARDGENTDSGFGGGVSFSNGRVIVATGFGDVFGLNAENGEELWKRSVGVPVRNAPTSADGQVYVTTVDNRFLALSDVDGSTLWTFRGISEVASLVSDATPAVMGNLVVAPFSSGELVAFQAQNGRQLWADQLTRSGRITSLAGINDISGRPVISRGRVIAVSHNGRLVSIDLRSGRRFWSHNITSIETPWVAGDSVFVVTTTGDVVALNFDDGRVRWVSDLPSFKNPDRRKGPIRWAGPVLANEQLVLASSHGKLLFLSPSTGEVLGERSIGNGTFIAPIVADGKLFVLTSGGDLIAFGERGAQRTATINAPETSEGGGGADVPEPPAAGTDGLGVDLDLDLQLDSSL